MFTTKFNNLSQWLSHLTAPRVFTSAQNKPPNELRSATTVTLLKFDPLHSVDSCFLSFSIDISVIAGGFWWEGSSTTRKGLGTIRVPALNLNNSKLDKLVNKLAPAYLRVGGSEADKIHYFHAPEDEPNCLVLTDTMWDNLQAFIQRNNLKFTFTFKYGLFKRKLHGKWQASEIENLLRHAQAKNHRLDACELGNELNAYWAFHGVTAQPRAKNLALDYHEFILSIKAYYPNALIIGPGSAFWPKLGETIRPFSNITQKFLEACNEQSSAIDIVDWHYYPFQSARSPVRTRAASILAFLKPFALNDFAKYAKHIQALRDKHTPNAQLWTGETGSAQCGGEPKLSDRFISCFWWADQLGLGALNHQQVMIRQSLIGGEYGLVDRLTLKPRPDYWLSWLWKQLMGDQVFSLSNPHHLVRSYCHNTPNSAGKTLLLINLSARDIEIKTQELGDVIQQFSLTAKRLRSKRVKINGIKARFKQGDFNLEDFKNYKVEYRLKGHSINFWLIQ